MAIKRAKPGPKIIKLSDGHGLQLWVTLEGAKRWRMAYRFGDAQMTLAIGVYPTIGLKEARQAREDARRSLSKGQDLSPAISRCRLERMCESTMSPKSTLA